MKVKLCNNNRQEIAVIDIEINQKMFVLVPKIVDDNFRYLEKPLFKMRKIFMESYIQLTGTRHTLLDLSDLEDRVLGRYLARLTEEIHKNPKAGYSIMITD